MGTNSLTMTPTEIPVMLLDRRISCHGQHELSMAEKEIYDMEFHGSMA